MISPLCERCEEQFRLPHSDYCQDCQNRMEADYEDSLGEAFRGGEAQAYEAEQQHWIQRNLK
jgi:hypothetical protein